MLIAAAIALPLLFQSGAGLEYTEALARATKYATDAKAQFWRTDTLNPFLTPRTKALFGRCYPASVRRPVNFTLVLSFEDGKFDRVVSDSDDAVAECMIDAFAEYRWPQAPYADFAEVIHVVLKPE
jgi:hypothetical protein